MSSSSMRLTPFSLAVMLIAGLSMAAGAAPIFTNGLPNTENGYSVIGTSATADDFTLTSSAAIQGVAFYFQNYQGITGWNQDIDYAFRADNGGAPAAGPALASGSGLNVTAVDSGLPWCCQSQPGGENAYLVTFDLEVPFNATGGTMYWLELSGASGSATSAWWVTAGANSTEAGWHGSVGSMSFQSASQFAFALYDAPFGPSQVPEPATFALIGLGGLALAALRRFEGR
jgi:hypothetical protein